MNTQQNKQVFNSLDEINSDDKGYAKNAEDAFKGKTCSKEQSDVYNVSSNISSTLVEEPASRNENRLLLQQQSKTNQLPSLKSADTILRGPNLNRIKVHNTNRSVISTFVSFIFEYLILIHIVTRIKLRLRSFYSRLLEDEQGFFRSQEMSRGPLLRYTWSSNINESLDETQDIKSKATLTSKVEETIILPTDSNLKKRQAHNFVEPESKNAHIRTVDTSQVIPVVDIV